MANLFTVIARRDFDQTPEQVFDAWIDPECRAIFEMPAGSGMRQGAFDTRPGGTEEVIIAAGGADIGKMISDIRVMVRPNLMVVHGRGVFGGEIAMTMQTTFEITPRGTGSTFTGTSQICTLGPAPTEAQVSAGWAEMLDRFAAVLDGLTQGDGFTQGATD